MKKNYTQKYFLIIVLLISTLNGWGQVITEGFESGLPTAYTATTSYSLTSGTWTGQMMGVIRTTSGVHGGTYALQLRSQTGAQITTPNIASGISKVTFWASISTGSGSSLQVNYSTDGGTTWNVATGSPFSLNTTVTQYTATINSTAPNLLVQFYRTYATVYIDDINIYAPYKWTGNVNMDWNIAGNWASNLAPDPSSLVTIPSGLTNYPLISAGENTSAFSVSIASGATLTMSGSGNLTISNGGTFTNNGGTPAFIASGTGAVIFAGSGTITGTSSFNNVIINGAVNFGTSSTITGNLTLENGSSLSNSHTVTYTATSILTYDAGTGNTITSGYEWNAGGSGTTSAGAGIPQNVTINSGTASLGAVADRALAGTLTIANGAIFNLSTTAAHDLYILGNWINNGGTLNANGRAVTFKIGINHTISGNTTFYDLGNGTEAGDNIDFGTSITTIADQFTNNGMTQNTTSTVIFTGNSGSINGGASSYFYNLQINSGANITQNTIGVNVHVTNSFLNTGTFSQYSGNTFYFEKSGATETFSGTGSASFGNLTIGLGSLSFPTKLNVSTNFTIKGTALSFGSNGSSVVASTGTATFSTNDCSIKNQTNITGTSVTFNNLTTNVNITQVDVTNVTVLNSYNPGAGKTYTIGSNTLTLNGGITATGTITGSSTSNLVIGGTAGIINFTPGGITNVLKTFTVNNGGNVTLGDSLYITAGTASGTVIVNGAIATNGYLVLRSDINGTARVGNSSGTISGDVTVERFIPAVKAWRFLAIPTKSTTQTIKAAWQEGALMQSDDPIPKYGTQITSDMLSWLADGFDAQSFAPSVKTYNQATNTYSGIASTNIPFNSSPAGYMAFIRGDRTVTTIGQLPKSTTLRTTGTLFTGDQPAITLVPGKFIPVNNPFASQLDLSNISQDPAIFYYVFDPNLGSAYGYGYGAFHTLSWNSTNHNYDVVPPNSGSYGASTNYIAEGQAFFAAGNANIQLTESAKTAATTAIIPFTPVGIDGINLFANLYSVHPDGSANIVDGVLTSYGDKYSNDVDDLDARKLSNFGENLAIKNSNLLLAIERRRTIQKQDTVFLSVTGAKQQQYRIEIIPVGFSQTGLDAFFEDGYLNTRTPLDITDTTYYNFNVNTDSGSEAPDRFRIVIGAAAGPLPVTFTNVKAYPKDEGITLEWTVSNETGIASYDVEKSIDGTRFIPAASVSANGTSPQNAYSWQDEQPVAGYNYYRIKSLERDAVVQYSRIVRVLIEKLKQGIHIFPNPIADGIIHLRFIDEAAGTYRMRLINRAGQEILLKEIQLNSPGNSIETISVNGYKSHGIYRLEIIKPDGSRVNLNVVL